ncbi:MAG: biliverdin-producing heme oxygenase [Spirochaetia bacterium]|nr:biliverdin-producing heme oxygenase [Spirochaetia bacterium]
MNLSSLLKEGTAEVHRNIEKSSFMGELFKGKVSKDIYLKYLENFFYLYNELEYSVNLKLSEQNLKKLYFPDLHRTKALYLDLIYFGGASFIPSPPSEKTIRYINHIKEITEKEPYKIISHLYVRYLGDLSGGQILGGIIRKTFSLEKGFGDSFYSFPIGDVDHFKNTYRAQLDSLGFEDSQKLELLEEAKLAFSYNGMMLSELDIYTSSPK